MASSPLGGEELLLDGGLALPGQGFIGALVRLVPQGLGGLGGEGGGVVVEGGGHIPQVRGAHGVLGVPVLPVQGQPVSQLGPPEPQAPAAVGLVVPPDPLHPGLHHRVLLAQQLQVPVVFVQGPGHHGGHVAPDGHPLGVGQVPRAFLLRLGGGHEHRHRALEELLLQADAVEEVVEEGGHVQVLAGGAGDHRGVAGPAQALVPLGAVGGHV